MLNEDKCVSHFAELLTKVPVLSGYTSVNFKTRGCSTRRQIRGELRPSGDAPSYYFTVYI